MIATLEKISGEAAVLKVDDAGQRRYILFSLGSAPRAVTQRFVKALQPSLDYYNLAGRVFPSEDDAIAYLPKALLLHGIAHCHEIGDAGGLARYEARIRELDYCKAESTDESL